MARRLAGRQNICDSTAPISPEDLEQEAALHLIQGRRSVNGPMQDALIKEGHYRSVNKIKLIQSGSSDLTAEVYERAPSPQAPERAKVDAARVNQYLGSLSDRRQEVINLYYWQGLSMAEIGRRMGIHESRVSQIHKSAIQTLKKAMGHP